MNANCCYCRKPITVKLDPNYDAEKDPSELLKAVACRKCREFKANTPKLFWEWLAKKRMEETVTTV